MKSRFVKLIASAVVAAAAMLPVGSAQAWPWGFNCCGISAGQSWGPGWWGRGWGGYPYYGWGYPYYYPYYSPYPYYGWATPWAVPAPSSVVTLPTTGEEK
jgi:hypothetical protein